MPKVLIYISSRIVWLFLFYGTDFNEGRAHVHVGKKGMTKLCKIWLEPEVEVADTGDLNSAQINEVLKVTSEHKEILLKQWENFKSGKKVSVLTVKR